MGVILMYLRHLGQGPGPKAIGMSKGESRGGEAVVTARYVMNAPPLVIDLKAGPGPEELATARGLIPVVDQGRLVGLLDGELLRSSGKPWRDLISTDLGRFCVSPNAGASEIIARTGCPAGNVAAYVVSEAGALLGEVLWSSLARAMLQERLEKEEELRDFQAVFDGCPDSLFVTDGEGTVLMCNPSSKHVTGTSAEEAVGRNVRDMESEGVFSPSVTVMVLRTGNLVSTIQRVSNGRHILVTGVPIKDDSGRILRVVTVSRDISKLLNEVRESSGLKKEIERMKKELAKAKLLTSRLQSQIRHLKRGQLGEHGPVALSQSMVQVLDLARTVAEVDSTVLILGESGVGKEVVADYIHQHSLRANSPLVKVSCGAIPEALLESELFGYEGGAFTGASPKGKMGLLEVGDGGTVFLDEIGDLPLSLQVKLLRVLEERQIVRVGCVKRTPVDLRFIAATNRDLEDMVRQGRFREDLYYRLNVIPIYVPPLRERADDIPALAVEFLEMFGSQYGRAKRICTEAMELLQGYSWPGNVRELRNLVERLVITVSEDVIGGQHLPPRVKEGSAFSSPLSVKTLVPLEKGVEELERQLIKRALEEFKTVRGAAEALGVNQSTVSRKAAKYGIAGGKQGRCS